MHTPSPHYYIANQYTHNPFFIHPLCISIQHNSLQFVERNNMCILREDRSPSPPMEVSKRRQQPKKPKLQVIGLTRNRRRCGERYEDMELKNLKLYLQNRTIFQENEKLRQKAYLLHRENLALTRELQNKLPHLDHFSTTLVHEQ